MPAEMSPVELLRAAAAKLRETAKNTTAGPWGLMKTTTLYMNGHSVYNICTKGRPGDKLKVTSSDADAQWIALVHPGMADPLAAWLEHEAVQLASAMADWSCGSDALHAEAVDDLAQLHHGEALAVARVLLGVPDGR